MELLSFVKMEQNESAVDANERKKHREYREYLKELQAEGETLWCYPFVDSPHSNGVIQKVRVNLKGHLIGTIITEIGKMDVVLDKLQIRHSSDRDDYQMEFDASTESEQPKLSLKAEFEAAWADYIKDFN